MHVRTIARRVRPLAAVIAFAACSDPLAPFQPEVSNSADSFQLQASNVAGVTATKTWTWSNSGTRATINHSTTTSSGSARLLIKDAAGVTVYDKALSPSLNEPTTAGQSGSWTIQLTMSSYNGTMNFRAQKL